MRGVSDGICSWSSLRNLWQNRSLTEGAGPQSEDVRQTNLGCQISDCCTTEEGGGDYETSIQYDWQEGHKNTVQMLHMLQHVCLTVRQLRLLHSTCVIDERKNKTNMPKLHTHNNFHKVFHCFVRDILPNNSYTCRILVALGSLNHMLKSAV